MSSVLVVPCPRTFNGRRSLPKLHLAPVGTVLAQARSRLMEAFHYRYRGTGTGGVICQRCSEPFLEKLRREPQCYLMNPVYMYLPVCTQSWFSNPSDIKIHYSSTGFGAFDFGYCMWLCQVCLVTDSD